MKLLRPGRPGGMSVLAVTAALLCGAGSSLLGICGPFTDVSDPSFCPFVLEVFTLGITTGTTPTTYDPTGVVTRLQMAAFLSRTVDSVLRRGSRRAALAQFSTTQGAAIVGLTTVGDQPILVKSDGANLWVANFASATVSRVRGSDGRLLETWTGADFSAGALAASGRVFVTGSFTPGRLYRIDPSQPAGAVTTVASNLGGSPLGLAFDGLRIWTANAGVPASVSIVTPGGTIPWTVTTVTAGFNNPRGALYDGSNVWVTDQNGSTLLRLSPSAAILLTVTVGTNPQYPVFDGANIWVPNFSSSSVTVVRASNGAVLATLTGNGLTNPRAMAFDGQRIISTDDTGSVSLWKAADLTPLGTFAMPGIQPYGACSDGINFWITLSGSGLLARF